MVKRRFDINLQRQTIVMLSYVSITLSFFLCFSFSLIVSLDSDIYDAAKKTDSTFLCLFIVVFLFIYLYFFFHGYIYWQLTIKTWSTVNTCKHTSGTCTHTSGMYVCMQDDEKLRKPFSVFFLVLKN